MVVMDCGVQSGERLIAASMTHCEHAVEYMFGSWEGEGIGEEGWAKVADDRRVKRTRSRERRGYMLRMLSVLI
jgi:hypothetical protein